MPRLAAALQLEEVALQLEEAALYLPAPLLSMPLAQAYVFDERLNQKEHIDVDVVEQAVAGGEVLPVEVGVAEVPVAQAGVGVLDEGLAQTLSQTGRTVATELSPIYPHASIPESLQSMPKLVLSNSPESMSSLSRASLTTFTSKDSLAPIAGELTDSTGKIFSRTAGEVTDHALSKFGLKTRGWQDIADAANELFGHVPIAGWKMNPPIEGWYPPVAPAVKRSNASEQVATQNATKGATTKYTVSQTPPPIAFEHSALT